MLVFEPLAIDRSFVKYDETDKVQDSKLHTDKIAAMHPLLAGLYELDDKLSFKKSVLSAAFSALFARKSVTWGMNEKFEEAWVKSMTNRVANACRQVNQGMMKSKHPSWVEQLPWMAGLARSGAEAAKAEEPADTDGKSEYFFGFDTEVRNAFRCKAESMDKKELAIDMYKPEGAASHDPVCAKWSDGMQHSISDITCGDFDKLMGGRESDKPPSKIFFDEEMKDTHHRVTVKPRPDRSLLVSMYEQGKQILQIPVKHFGPEDSEEAMEKAASMMIILAKQFCSNELKRADLKDARTKLLKTVDKYKPPKGVKASAKVMKKPAAATKAGMKTEPVAKPEMMQQPACATTAGIKTEPAEPDQENEEEEEEMEEEEEELEDEEEEMEEPPTDGFGGFSDSLAEQHLEAPETPRNVLKKPASSSSPAAEHATLSPAEAYMPEPPSMTMVEILESFSRNID
jgi:hypothetical protein